MLQLNLMKISINLEKLNNNILNLISKELILVILVKPLLLIKIIQKE